MQCRRTCTKIRRDYAEKDHEITVVEHNYPNFKQKSAEKEDSVLSKVSESQLLLRKFHPRAASFHKLTSEEIRVRKQKIFPKSCFLDKFSRKTRLKFFVVQPRGHNRTQQTLRVTRRHTLEAIL